MFFFNNKKKLQTSFGFSISGFYNKFFLDIIFFLEFFILSIIKYLNFLKKNLIKSSLHKNLYGIKFNKN